MKKKKITGLSLNKKTVSELNETNMRSIHGGTGGNSLYSGTYPASQCCPYNPASSSCIIPTTALAGCHSRG